jgi:hypothetical protein
MTLKMKLAVVLAVLVVAGVMAPAANAWYGGGSFWCGAYPGYWLPPSLLQERPPYFAFYPPVYYSHPIYASYGVSPYPRGSRGAAAEPAAIVPLTVRNEYVDSEVLAANAAATASRPLRITNPFVSPQGDGAGRESQVQSRPQIVYPVSVAR